MDCTSTQPDLPRRCPLQQGAAAVEFAIVIFVLLLIFAGVVEFGRAFWYYDALGKGTRNAVRLLSMTPATNLGATVASDIQKIVVDSAARAGVPGFGNAHVSYSCAPTACAAATQSSDVTFVTVEVNYNLTIGGLIPFLSSSGASWSGVIALQPHTTMRYMY